MRRLLFIFTLFISFISTAQTVQTSINIPYSSGGTTYPSLLYLPNDYNTSGKRYPLLVFYHGAGEAGSNLALIYNSATAGGPAYFIEHSGWDTSGYTNPMDGLKYKFIVISPQRPGGWGWQASQLNYHIKYMIDNYRVDTSRIYTTGISAGGAGVFGYNIHYDYDAGASVTPFYKPAASVPMAPANTSPNQTQANVAVADSIRFWGLGGASDGYGDVVSTMRTLMNNTKPGIARVTRYSGGHCCWGTYYNPTYRESIKKADSSSTVSMNIYEWMLQFARTDVGSGNSSDPTANAGADQSLSLGTTSTTLSGSGTGGDGTISSYAWTRISGPNTPTIVSASSASTSVTGMIAGTYVFRLTVTNSLAETATDDITVTIAAGCGGTKKYVTPNSVTGGYNSYYSTSSGYQPGDTIVLQASYNPWGYFGFGSVAGTASCPIIVMQEGGQVTLKDGIAFENVQYVKVLGNLGGLQYGFKVESNLADPNNVAIGIAKKSRNVEVANVYVTNSEYGCWIKNEAECDTTINYPNWWLDSISVHDCYFKGMDSQGFYMGSTDPNNLDRPISCDSSGFTVTKYYAPTRLRNIKIYNNIIDSTGRPGIQLSAGMEGINEIYNNTISNVGTQYDDAQGAGISLGGYTRALVYGNRIKKTLTWGIVALGASGLSKIYDNVIDSSGRLGGTTLTWPANIHIDTRTTTPVDSTTFQIRNNVMNNPGSASYNVTIADQRNTITNKNVICNNITFGNKPATISNSETLQSLNCNTAFHTLPSITLSGPDTITLPLDSITLNVTLVTTSDTAGRIYKWTKLKSPSATNKRITVIGSSTVEGYGVSATQNFVYLLKEHYKGLGLIDTIYNLGLGGTDPINYNYTTALNKGAEIFLMSFPTNGYDSYSISTILAEYREARDSCLGRGVEFFCTGTQPRNPYSDANRIKLNTINDSLRNIFGERFIDFNTFLLNKDGNLMKTAYDQGDGFHINASGHAQLAELVIAANMFQAFATGSTVNSHSAIIDSTLATDNVVGTHLYQLSVWDTYGVGNSEVYQLVQEDVPGDPGEPYKGFKLRGRRIKF